MATTIDLPHIKTLSWTTTTTYDASTIILYNLALGTPGSELSRVYESHPSFHALPTFGCMPVIAIMGQVTKSMSQFLPNFQPHNHVHAEHYLQLRKPFPPTRTKLETTAKILDIVSQKRGVSVVVEIQTIDASTGAEICYNEWTSVVLNVPSEGASIAPTVSASLQMPSRAPDHIAEHKTSVEQSALYRAASGDLNPLHIDPEVARKGGFPGPLLTGTCTIGIGVRHVLDAFCGGDVEGFDSVRVKLRKPVFPGEVVRTEMWKLSDGEVLVRMSSGEERRVVIVGHVYLKNGCKVIQKAKLA